jgi:hypothetical protein
MPKTLKNAKGGIAEFISSCRLTNCSMTWNGKSWLIIVGRGNGVASCRGAALQSTLREAIAILDGERDSRSGLSRPGEDGD